MALPALEALQQEIAVLEQQLNDPVLLRQPAELKRIAAERAHKQELLEAMRQLAETVKEREQAEELANDGNKEMQIMAQEELNRLTHRQHQLERMIAELLFPRDPRDSRDIILEIRAGTGGEEAALFATELFRMYSRYAERQGWRVRPVSVSFSEQSGYKEMICEMTGKNVFAAMKYERGVHRVQRIPATEKQGRVHTSTVTVAVLPEAEEVDLVIRPEDLRVDTYRAGGAGGQHVNKTSSAVRLTHIPTNTVVAVQDERSQHKNKDKAMKILRARLLAAQEEALAQAAAQERRSQIGTGERSEKIRTYNFPQDRLTDHRIKKSWGNIAEIMEGNLSPIFTVLQEAAREATLQHLDK